jgi:hypothetical protein
MAKHRAVSRQSVHARTVVGGVLAAGAVILAAPVGIASASPTTHTTNTDKGAAAKAAMQVKPPVSPFRRELREFRQFLRSLDRDEAPVPQPAP